MSWNDPTQASQGFQLACPACQQAMNVPGRLVGRRVKCPTCGTVFLAGPPAPPPPPPTAELIAPGVARPPRVRPSAARTRSKGASSTVIIICCLVGVLIFTTVAVVILSLAGVPLIAERDGFDVDLTKDNPFRPPMMLDGKSLDPKILERTKRATVFIRVDAGQESASGSGFLAMREGTTALVVTNQHVVDPTEDGPGRPDWRGQGPLRPFPMRPRFGGAPRITVVFDSGTPTERSYAAQVIAKTADPDLAVLRVQGVRDLPEPLNLKAPPLQETERVFFFGFPFGQQLAVGRANPAVTVSQGTITALRRDGRGKLRAVQVECDLNPGNSGGPAINSAGQLVGIAVAIVEDTNIGLLIHPDELSAVLRTQYEPAQTVLRSVNGQPELLAQLPLHDPENQIQEVVLRHRCGPDAGPLPMEHPETEWQPLANAEILPLRVQLSGLAAGVAPLPQLQEGHVVVVQTGYRQKNGRWRFTEAKVLRSPVAAKPAEPGAPRPDDPGPPRRPPAVREPRTIGKVVPPHELPGAMASWSFDEGQGDVAKDGTKNDQAAQLAGHGWVKGVLGKAIRLDGEEGCVDFGDGEAFNFKAGEPFTFVCWIKTQARFGNILALRHHANGVPVIGISLWGAMLKAEVRDDDGNVMRPAVETDFARGAADNQWHHVALLRKANGQLELWLDGERAAAGAPRPFGNGLLNTCAGAITTTHRIWGMDRRHQQERRQLRQNFYQGALDECGVFRRELSSEELRRLAGRE